MHLGDSIAVNGVCLTATSFTAGGFTADVMHETLNRSALAALRPGSRVNLERAMAAGGRFGGHIVAGHVDGVGTVQNMERDDNAIWYTHRRRGRRCCATWWRRAPSPWTASASPWPGWTGPASPSPPSPTPWPSPCWPTGRSGDRVNLETDIIGKYVEKLLQPAPEAAPQRAGGGITREFLARYGF